MMLRYTFGLEEQLRSASRTRSRKCWPRAIRTGDIYERGTNKVGTQEMGDAVLAALA